MFEDDIDVLYNNVSSRCICMLYRYLANWPKHL